MLLSGEVIECNNYVDTLILTTLRPQTFAKINVCGKIFCDIKFLQF